MISLCRCRENCNYTRSSGGCARKSLLVYCLIGRSHATAVLLRYVSTRLRRIVESVGIETSPIARSYFTGARTSRRGIMTERFDPWRGVGLLRRLLRCKKTWPARQANPHHNVRALEGCPGGFNIEFVGYWLIEGRVSRRGQRGNVTVV